MIYHGWLILDKPKGVTSASVLNTLKKIIGRQKVGHLGTLDALATGVLPVALGEATKLIPFIKNEEKTYLFTIHWGEKRSTGDAKGEILATSNNRPTRKEIENILSSFLGPQLQKPPLYSALKIEGKRASDRVRAGETLDLKPRPIFIQSLDLIEYIDADHAKLRLHCSKGTYVRSLIEDMAQKLSTYAFADNIHRESSGNFNIKDAISIETLAKDPINLLERYVRALPVVLDDIPAMRVDDEKALLLRQGRFLARPSSELEGNLTPSDCLIALYDEQNRLLGIAKDQGNQIRPIRILNL
ncbi:tRNA pseudouridine(55) synthase TruB [Candidatus Nucleicultrix amoebiphila]|jgi:tRNA pseudouridine55 synthase|uniref:tRNA pseudouridine synthase B n=1 Tax=Candidatus Nucleicultrix amoebiphila FS5 TaxID=1414854 RepID=A0A1W6N480_9PROT|nr:tRNA pseudouridine(55) synthase TruB [Candidatus Nucleicultrix amoebiphila]ARN84568.1 hypothetical protein GQ61_03730 [Candidatus Nucleicultrix amoebiphila FS5]